MARKSKRQAFLRDRLGPKLTAAAADDFSFPEGGDPLEVLAAADPSPNFEYLPWLCRSYLRRAFRAEDAERVRNTLTLFHRWKHRLPLERRDILRHPDEQSVWEATAPFDPSRETDLADPAGRELRRRERLRALAESDLPEPDGLEGWTVAAPKTHFAARWWGRGTRWCTSMQNPWSYESYARRGQLRVFIDPDGNKFQAHVATRSCADSSDRPYPLERLVEALPESAVALLKADVSAVADQFRSGIARKEDEAGLLHCIAGLPTEIVDGDLAAAARRAGLSMIRDLASCDDGWRLSLVSRLLSKWALGLIDEGRMHNAPPFLVLSRPEGQRLDVPLASGSQVAFRALGTVLSNSPLPFRHEAVCAVAALFWTKGGFRTRSELPAFIADLGVHNVPKEAWLAIAAAVSRHGHEACGYSLPEEVVDDEIADVLARGMSFDAIPPAMLTKERMVSVLQRNPSLLAVHPMPAGLEGKVDGEVAFAVATSKNGKGMEFVPSVFVTRRFCRRVLSVAPAAISHVPPEFLDEDLCVDVVSANGSLVNDVPDEWRTERVWRAAVANNASMFCFMPQRYRDEETCMRVIEASPDQFTHVDYPLRYADYLRGVRVSGSLLARVPLEYRDEAMCRAAVEKQADARAHVPKGIAEKLAGDGMEAMKGAKLSSRYGPGHPIHSFVLPDEIPDRLRPMPPMSKDEATHPDDGMRTPRMK